MLIGFFNHETTLLREQLFATLQRRLRIYDSEIARELPPSNLEIQATPNIPNTVAEVNCYDGLSYDLHLSPWSTTSELAERILKQRGVGIALGWTVEVETPNRVFVPTGSHFIHDVFSQIEGATLDSDDQQNIFFNFPPEKLVKKAPKEPEQVVEQTEKVDTPKLPRHYPTPEEWSNQPPIRNESRNTPMDHRKSAEESDESLIREYNEDAGYAYTLPRKNKPKQQESEDETSESEDDVREDAVNRVGYESGLPQENMKMTETIQDHSHILKSPILPRKTYSRNEHIEEYTPMNFAPPPTFTYPQQMTMMQYVPVMMTPSMIPGQQIAMIPQQMMMQPQFSYVPQYPQIPQYRPPEPILSPQSARSEVPPMMAPVMYDGHESTRSRDFRKMKRGEVPSQYSTIRNMPVPEHGKDVDQFLDAVFDQMLSKDEQRAADFTAQQLTGTIKGGRVRPEGYYEPPQQNYSPVPPRYPTLRRVDDSPVRSRAKSLPRILSPSHHDHYVRRPQSRNSYSNESTSSDDQINYRTRSRERSLPRFHSNNGYNYDPSQPVYMMPVQMNGHGEMILLSPVGSEQKSRASHGTHDRSRRHATSGVERYMAKRSPSVDMLKPHISRSAQSPVGRHTGRFEEFSALPRGDSRTRERMENPLLARQYQRTFPYQNGTVVPPPPSSYRSPSPAPTAIDRKGLNRLPQETYTEPAVKSTKNNSEYLSPHRFNLDEQKAVIRHEKETARNALNMLSDRLRKLPPPVDNVRLIRPVTPVQRPITPSPVPSEPVVIPSPSPPPQPTPPPPAPVRQEWVVKDFVERDPETQGRIRGSFKKEPLVPQPPRAPVVAEKPAVKFVKAPWKLTIRKEMFYPGETLNDIQIIDQVFAQIVEDCKKSYPYRIRLQDRKQVEDVLRANKIPPSDLNNQTNIHPDVKVAIIEKARLWPLYFNQIYEVIEKRPDESVSIIFAISEHGIRLIVHTPHDLEHPLKIQDFFPFETISDVSLEANDILSIHVRHENEENAYSAVRIKTNQAPQIKKTLERCLSGGVVPKRKFVRALEDYVTSEVNHLSFKQGDVIELLPAPEGETPPVGNWLYGRIENRFGFLLAQYVDSSDGDAIPPIRYENSAERDERVKFFDDEVPFSKEEWAWEDIAQAVRYSDRVLSHSLLADLGSEESKYAVETFHAILKFMGDEPLKKSESMTDVVFKVLLICHRHPTLRDEVYCQLIKQTTSNNSPKPNSALRAWRLLTIITAYFPSSLTLKPYILQYLGDNADDWQRPYHGTARICQTNMIQTFKYGGRKVLLNALEVQQITDGCQLRRQPFFISREHSVSQTLRPITVAEEMIQELCSLLNVRSLHEQQEFSLCYTIGKEKRLNYCKNDNYLMDIITESEHKKLPFQFHLKRTVWVHPLRYDNAAYIDSMFDQVIDDYLRGSLISTTSLGQLTAATTEEIIKLAAYLFLLLPDNPKGLTAKILPQIVPKSVIEPKHRHQEEMVTRINRQLKMFGGRMRPAEAKSHFLELLSTWPLFGVLHYRLKSVVENGNQLPEVILTINKTGIQLLQPKSKEVFKRRNYDQIESVESIRKTAYKIVRLVINTPEGEETLDIKTDEADEISHLIGQYMFVTVGIDDRGSTEL
uniref:PAX-interacting protein 1 n=1 Tax=Caenorhabditis tropicalis TaxID=1561998 RepID=A0A1I7T3H3_9PELO